MSISSFIILVIKGTAIVVTLKFFHSLCSTPYFVEIISKEHQHFYEFYLQDLSQKCMIFVKISMKFPKIQVHENNNIFPKRL